MAMTKMPEMTYAIALSIRITRIQRGVDQPFSFSQ